MNLILRYLEGRKVAPTGANPKLTQELKDTQTQLNQILNKWKFGDTPLTSAEEFLNNFEPWINRQLEQQKEWKVFLAKKGVSSLKDLADLPENESEQLAFYKENIKIKEEIINEYKEAETTWTNTQTNLLKQIEDLEFKLTEASHQEELEQVRQELAQQEQTFLNTEAEYLKKIDELREEVEKLKTNSELPEDYEDLITERDELTREKKTLEQSVLALNNRLNLKQQEVTNKEQALERLKKETSQKELTHQKQLKEKNGLITTLNQEIKQHKEKYSKQGKLLDTEQLECKRLEEENENLKNPNPRIKRRS